MKKIIKKTSEFQLIHSTIIIWTDFHGNKTQKQPKNTKNAFLPVLEPMSDSLTVIYIKPHQCPSHQSILLTQEPICEIFAKKFWELAILKNELFLSRPFWIFFSKKKKIFAWSPWKFVTNYVIEWMGLNFDVFPGFQQIPCCA